LRSLSKINLSKINKRPAGKLVIKIAETLIQPSFQGFYGKTAKILTRKGFQGFSGLLPNNSKDCDRSPISLKLNLFFEIVF
jgi:hypothetical protein